MENMDWLHAAAHVGLSNKWLAMAKSGVWFGLWKLYQIIIRNYHKKVKYIFIVFLY